jgi:PAS domain S-box-containing protein
VRRRPWPLAWLRPDLSGTSDATALHLRRTERLVWGAVAGHVTFYVALEAAVGRWLPGRWRGWARIGAVALSSLAATTQINRVTLSRSAAFANERDADRAALRESEMRLRALVENAPVVLFATDAAGVVTLSEGRALTDLGLRPGEVVGRPLLDVYGHLPGVAESMRRVLAGEAFTATTHVGGLAFETRYEPVRDAAGRVTGGVGVATDVTERVRGEAAEREAERDRSRLDAALLVARTVAHEINNALSPISGGAELLRMDPEVAAHPSRSAYLTMIESAAQEVAAKVRRLQSIVRVEAQESVLGADQPVLDMERSTRT